MPTIATPTLSQSQSQEFLTWNDPQGEYSIEYPSDWTVKERENRFEPWDVVFTSPTGEIDGFVGVEYDDETVEEVAGVEERSDAYIEGFSSSINNFREVEDRSFSKYTINGEPAASVVYAGDIYGQAMAGLLVVPIINDRIFNFAYGAGQDEFDSALPTAELMISSIQIPAVGETD